MKKISIVLNDELQWQAESLVKLEGRDEKEVVLDALQEGLLVRRRREQVVKDLEKAFSIPVSSLFHGMTEDEVMRPVEEDIAAYHKENTNVATNTMKNSFPKEQR